MTDIPVKAGSARYLVKVEPGIISELPGLIGSLPHAGRVFPVYDAQVFTLYGARLTRLLRAVKAPEPFVIPSGEKAKTAQVLAALHGYLLDNGINRDDILLAVGGGVTSDLVGFAAATVLRGVRYATVSTTLLGMVDAAIGGKTGINHRLGKNLIGAFWQPSLVLCDTDFLYTLDRRQVVCGLGEIAKYAGLSGVRMMVGLRLALDEMPSIPPATLQLLIESSVRYKARIVAADERENGRRMVLNLGHTFAHGIETSLGHGRLLHGEAVILGLRAAVELSVALGVGSAKSLESYVALLEMLMSLVPKRRLDGAAVMEAMHLDKKRRATGPKYVLLERPGRPIIADKVPPRAVRAAVGMLPARYHTAGRA